MHYDCGNNGKEMTRLYIFFFFGAHEQADLTLSQ